MRFSSTISPETALRDLEDRLARLQVFDRRADGALRTSHGLLFPEVRV